MKTEKNCLIHAANFCSSVSSPNRYQTIMLGTADSRAKRFTKQHNSIEENKKIKY